MHVILSRYKNTGPLDMIVLNINIKDSLPFLYSVALLFGEDSLFVFMGVEIYK